MISIDPRLDIIVVDDSDADLLITDIVLKRSHLSNAVVLLDSGERAIAHLEEGIAQGRALPALVLLDVNMPGMTGFDVLQFIRSHDAFGEQPVVAMLTSSEAKTDKDRSRGMGAHAFLAKKSGVSAFVEMINANFDNRE